jgi:hypothetical protein
LLAINHLLAHLSRRIGQWEFLEHPSSTLYRVRCIGTGRAYVVWLSGQWRASEIVDGVEVFDPHFTAALNGATRDDAGAVA